MNDQQTVKPTVPQYVVQRATIGTKEQTCPSANGKRFTLDMDIHPDVLPYIAMEVAGKSRWHGMHLDGG